MKKIPVMLPADYFQVHDRTMLLLQSLERSAEGVAFTDEKFFILIKNWLSGRQTCPAAKGKYVVLKVCF